MPSSTNNITAVILAGGQGSRLDGNDKGLLQLGDKPLVHYVIDRLQPQVHSIIISANRNIDNYKEFSFPVYPDDIDGFAGPLAGIYTALKHTETEWLLNVPADSPFLPADLASKLFDANENVKVVIPHDGEFLQPTFSLLHTSLLTSLEDYLQQGERKTQLWMKQHPFTIVDFSQQKNAFMNINTAEDLAQAEQHFDQYMA